MVTVAYPLPSQAETAHAPPAPPAAFGVAHDLLAVRRKAHAQLHRLRQTLTQLDELGEQIRHHYQHLARQPIRT